MFVEIKSCGMQRVQVVRKGVEIIDTGFQKNMLLNGFFNKLTSPTTGFNATDAYNRTDVGSGSTPPTATDTQLESRINKKLWSSVPVSVSGGSVNLVDNTLDYTYTRTFAYTEGEVVGNISEIGTTFNANAQSPDQLDTRALVRDDQGAPTTITVTSDDQLIVTHKLITKYPLDGITGSFDIGGTTHTWHWWPVNSTSYYSNQVLCRPAGETILSMATTYSRLMAGGLVSPIMQAGQALPTYSGGFVNPLFDYFTGYERKPNPDVMVGTIDFWFAASAGNLPGGLIGALSLGNNESRGERVASILTFDPPIPKDNKHKLTLTMSVSYTRL